MPLPSPSVFPDTSGLQNTETPPSRPSGHWKRLLLIGPLVLLAVLAWVLLNRQQTSMVSGRPLSYPQTHLHTIALSPHPGMVYLGTHYGIFTSSDGGHAWPQSQGDLHTTMVTSIAISPTNPDFMAVLTVPTSGLNGRMGIYVSADAGKTWRFTLPPHLPSPAYPYTIQSGVGEGGRFYAFFSYAGWFETRDLGRNWYAITHGSLANIQTPSLLIDPAYPDHLLMGGDQGLFETWSDGRYWQKLTAVQGNVMALAATTPQGSKLRTIFCATDQGLYRWQNGQPAEQLSNLPASSPPTRLAVSANGSTLYALSGSDLWFSTSLGATWVHRWHFARGDLVALVLNPANPNELLAGFYSPGLVLVSNDAGNSWQTLTS